MSFALAEVEAIAKKAARGVGYSWGMAEEAAKAARWLCENSFDGVGALAQTLARADGTDLAARAPSTLETDWQATAGEMCPLMAGATLSDSAYLWAKNGKRIHCVIAPVMLLPFAAMAARALAQVVTVQWNATYALTDGARTSLTMVKANGLLHPASWVMVHTGGTVRKPQTVSHRAMPNESDWLKLNAYAHRTYAPDTETSRLTGAGAGITDND